MVMLALIADFLTTVLFIVVYNWVPDWLIGPGPYNAAHVRNVFLVLGLIANSVSAVIGILYLAAVFTNRRPESV